MSECIYVCICMCVHMFLYVNMFTLCCVLCKYVAKLYVHVLCSALQSGPSDLKSEIIFTEVANRVKTMPDLVKKVKALYLWKITKNGDTVAQWSEFSSAVGGEYMSFMEVVDGICNM